MATHGGAVVIFLLIVVYVQCFLAKRNLIIFSAFVIMAAFLKKSKFNYNLPKKKHYTIHTHEETKHNAKTI